MAYMALFVLDDPDCLDAVLEKLAAGGYRGATILESSGLYRHQKRQIPMRYLYSTAEGEESDNESVVSSSSSSPSSSSSCSSSDASDRGDGADASDGEEGAVAAAPRTVHEVFHTVRKHLNGFWACFPTSWIHSIAGASRRVPS